VQIYLRDLTKDPKKREQITNLISASSGNATLTDLIETVRDAISKAGKERWHLKIPTKDGGHGNVYIHEKLDNMLQRLQVYVRAGDVMSQAGGPIACVVWGSFRVMLQVCSKSFLDVVFRDRF
jgi:hypothetical protein